VKYSPAEFRYKVYILDEVHMLTTEAFTPCSRPWRSPRRTRSSCWRPPSHTGCRRRSCPLPRFEFRRIGVPQISGALQRIADAEGIVAEPEALAAIARAADGGMRDSQSILDQLVAYAGERIDVATVNDVLGATDLQTLTDIVAAVLSKEHRRICEIVGRLIAQGKDLGQLLDDLMQYARDLARIALQCEPVGPAAGAEDQAALREQAAPSGRKRDVPHDASGPGPTAVPPVDPAWSPARDDAHGGGDSAPATAVGPVPLAVQPPAVPTASARPTARSRQRELQLRPGNAGAHATTAHADPCSSARRPAAPHVGRRALAGAGRGPLGRRLGYPPADGAHACARGPEGGHPNGPQWNRVTLTFARASSSTMPRSAGVQAHG